MRLGPRRLALLLAAISLFLGACRSRGVPERDLNYMVTHGQYAKAAREAAKLATEHPDDPHYARLHQLTRVGCLMEAELEYSLDGL